MFSIALSLSQIRVNENEWRSLTGAVSQNLFSESNIESLRAITKSFLELQIHSAKKLLSCFTCRLEIDIGIGRHFYFEVMAREGKQFKL